MIVIRQKFIQRQDLRDNLDTLYIFGDNKERCGNGGQAKHMRGEPNAYGVATKRKAAHGSPDCYFHDDEQDAWDTVKLDFDGLEVTARRYMKIVVPSDGIGTGLSKLPEYAPKLLEYINQRIERLKDL
jgi:hypothetical protein